jgi:hypothetical protein
LADLASNTDLHQRRPKHAGGRRLVERHDLHFPRRGPSARVEQNDLVAFASHAGTWKVVAPVNGSKADIRRSVGSDTRILTVPLESVTVVQCAGSPGYTY